MTSKLLGSLVLMGGLFGLVFALDYIFVSDSERIARDSGIELTDLLHMAGWLTPVFVFGTWMLSRVPTERLASRKYGYPWEVYFALPVLAYVIMACVSVILYMSYEAAVDFYAGKITSGLDHLKALLAALAYSFGASKVMGFVETRAATARRKTQREMNKKMKPVRDNRRRELMSMGALVHENDDGGLDETPSKRHHL